MAGKLLVGWEALVAFLLQLHGKLLTAFVA